MPRKFLLALTLGIAALTASRAVLAAERPNIILFITDDQDKESIGAYGADALTPNLDRMADEGMLFHQAYVSSTVCTPSRYSFLTGRYAGRSYSPMYLEACPPGTQGYPSFNVELEDDNMNVGGVLQQSGYVTGYVGKFHVGPEVKRPEQYERFGLQPIPTDAQPDSMASAIFRDNELWYRAFLQERGFSWAKHIYWGNLQQPFAHHNAEWTVEAALEFIEQNQDRPFYLHYCTTLVHGPDASWRNSMDHPLVSGEGLLDELPKVMTDRRELLDRLDAKGLDPMAGHAGYTWTDDSIGAVLDKLDELGIADNTLVVFIADHGSNMKGSLFKVDGTNIPCIMRWPEGIKPGSECDALIQNIDFAPTFFDVGAADVPEEYIADGRSLKPLFDGRAPERWRDHLYFEMGSGRAVSTKEWKYIAVRYTEEQVETIQNCSPELLPRNMSYIGRSGIGTRASVNANFFSSDQLYRIDSDDRELTNLIDNPECREPLETLRQMLGGDIEAIGRPFGEFLPGGNATAPGQIDEQTELVKKIRIEGKDVILPDGLSAEETPELGKEQRQAERDKRRAERRQSGS